MAKETTENEKAKRKSEVKSKKETVAKKIEKPAKAVKNKTETETKTKKASTKNAKKASTTKKKETKTTSVSKRTTSKKTTSKKQDKFQIVEYYDLPYTYNQTTVKILAQTPTTLFVYWDISEEDRKKYKENFGENFFENSKPILLIHNITKQTNYEVEINDFANSWYLKMTEPNCKYEIELARKVINNNQYISITNSNNLETPNDHILLENIYPGFKFLFRNVKTGEQFTKEFGSFAFMPDIYKLFEFYKTIYKDEIMEDDYKTTLSNPSSSSIFK